MKLKEIKQQILKLPKEQQIQLFKEIGIATSQDKVSLSSSRIEILDNRQGTCPHCGHTKYVKFGNKSGSQRYKCKKCYKTFTEYTGTWMAGIHHKDKIDMYIELMAEEKSLDKIKEELRINKKTAFDWRHKILSSLQEGSAKPFEGITESDETFFLESEKGKKVTHRPARKRGGKARKNGISDEQVAVIVTQDRKSQLDLTVATKGRITKDDIEKAIGHIIIQGKTILCSDSHVSYKGFAIDNKIEHYPLRSDLKQRVRNRVYHIQHVNSTHNRIKKWINEKFWGVSTKYLQQYLNWYKIKEQLKHSSTFLNDFKRKTTISIAAIEEYRGIENWYLNLISTPI